MCVLVRVGVRAVSLTPLAPPPPCGALFLHGQERLFAPFDHMSEEFQALAAKEAKVRACLALILAPI